VEEGKARRQQQQQQEEEEVFSGRWGAFGTI
jgi:hypothetical protein